MRALVLIERFDQRLHDGDCTVEGARIAPGFEVMSFGNMPMTEFGGLVFVLAEMYAQLRLE